MKGIISRRFYSMRSAPRSLLVMHAIAAAGIAIGTATLIVAVSIISGFQREYRKSILDFNAHVVILKASEFEDESQAMNIAKGLAETRVDKEFARRYDFALPLFSGVQCLYHLAQDAHEEISYRLEDRPDLLSLWDRFEPELVATKLPAGIKRFISRLSQIEKRGVVGVTPFLYREGLIIANGAIKGVVVKGVDPKTVRDVNQMKMQFGPGETIDDALKSDAKVPRMILGKALAERIGLSNLPSSESPGSVRQDKGAFDATINLMVPKTHKEKQFVQVKVSGIFESGLYDYDSQFALMAIDDVRRVFGTGDIKATGIELKLDDPGKANAVADRINEELAAPYQALTWSELNRDLFEALSLEKLVFSIIMGILVVVAAFNIIGVLVLLISFRAPEVAILKALGMRTGVLRKIFTRGGIVTGLMGTGAGLMLGIAMAFALKHYHWVRLEPEVYFLSTLPIDISWVICGMIALFSMLMCFVTSRMAAKRLSKIPIVEALKL